MTTSVSTNYLPRFDEQLNANTKASWAETIGNFGKEYLNQLILRPLTPVTIISSLLAENVLSSRLLGGNEQLTIEYCQEKITHHQNEENTEEVENWGKKLALLQRTRALADELDIRVNVFYSDSASYVTNWTNNLTFHKFIVEETDAQITDFLLAQELQKVKDRYDFKMLALKVLFFSLDIFALFTFPLGVLIIESIALEVESIASRYMIKSADLSATEKLETSEGAIKYFSKVILSYPNFDPKISWETLQQRRDYEGLDQEQIFELQKARCSALSTHPCISTRYDYCHGEQSQTVAMLT